MRAVTHWLGRRWAAHAEHVKLRRWQAVASESDNRALELGTDDNELAAPWNRAALPGPGPRLAAAEAATRGAFGGPTRRPTSGAE